MSDFPSVQLQAYLRWQADMGGDEVILDEPWKPRPMGANSGNVAARTGSPTQGLPHPGDLTGIGLLQSLAAEFAGEGSSSPGRAKRKVPAPAQIKVSELPSFKSLQTFQEFILSDYPMLAVEWRAGSEEPPVLGEGKADSRLMVLFLQPDTLADSGHILDPENDALFTRMLAAIGFSREEVYCTVVAKYKSLPGKLTRRHLARHWPWLQRELELVSAPQVLLMGESCAQFALKTGKSMEELRQGAPGLGDKTCTVTYHPAELSARAELKAPAWKDLQWLKTKCEAAGAAT